MVYPQNAFAYWALKRSRNLLSVKEELNFMYSCKLFRVLTGYIFLYNFFRNKPALYLTYCTTKDSNFLYSDAVLLGSYCLTFRGHDKLSNCKEIPKVTA